ncbi:MAG: Wzz/FepE/Etk N-terminal domain-containing protein, partial [Nitrospiraceae bacterium]|nr:Wzz/FepE/Etk N-terminal domain-containing protein [Nitrospiraceae bacterium]
MTNTSEFDYKKYLQLIGKHKYQFVIVALVIMTVVVISSFFLPKRYEAKCTVFIEKSVISDLVKGIAVSPSFEDKIKVLAYAIKSRSLLLKVFNDLDLNAGKQSDAQLENMIKEFQDRTDIKLKDKEGLFMISFVDKDPRLARDYVNALVRRYIEENLSSKRQDSYDATKFLGEQISTVKQKFEEAEAKLNSFKREKSAL